MKVMRDGRPVTVEVTSDGAGLVSHAGTALVAQVAGRVGLTAALSSRLAAIKQRRRGHDQGRVIRDLAVMLADGGECVSDLGAVREQDALFGAVASDSTAWRLVDRIASEPGMLDAVRGAHARARARFWELHGAPERLTLDVDATLITAHSEKEKAAGSYKGGYGFHPLQVYLDETHEALGGLLRSGNAGSNTAEDHTMVIDRALAQIPAEYAETLEILVRADSAGATHGLVDYCREGNLRFSAHWASLNPPPDPAAWARIADPDERLRHALSELYAWYEWAEPMLTNVYRDTALVPAMAQANANFQRHFEALHATLMRGRPITGRTHVLVAASIAHALDFTTWRSLTRDHRLPIDETVELMLALVAGASQTPPRTRRACATEPDHATPDAITS